jgi:uroporphyrinogen decarboxylase
VNPGFVRNVIRRVAEIQLYGVRRVTEISNVIAVWAVDDLAFGSGPMLHPGLFRREIFPYYEEFGKLCHERERFFFFHSDGLLWELIDDLIAVGIDALHPIDPTCMDIEAVMEKYGQRITLIGNIPNDLLQDGSPAQVEALVKTRLKALAPGGGYCLGSGNSIPDWASLENYRAMIKAGLTFGNYPIRIE